MAKLGGVKSLAINVFIVLLLVVMSSLLLPLLYRKEAASFMKAQFARHSDLVIQDFSTNISLFQHFPFVTFTFRDISIVDTSAAKPLQVLSVHKASFVMHIGALREDVVKIRLVKLQGVALYQSVDATGKKVGFRLKKQEATSGQSGKLLLALPKIIIEDGYFRNHNLYKHNGMAVRIAQAGLSAALTGDTLTLQGTFSGNIDYYQSEKRVIFRKKPFTGEGYYTYQMKEKRGAFRQSKVHVQGSTITLTGDHAPLTNKPGIKLNMQLSGQMPATDLLQEIIPPKAKPYFADVISNSNVQIRYHVTGESSPTQRPSGRLSLLLQNGELYWPKTNTKITHLNLDSEWTNGKQRSPETSTLTIRRLSARLGKDSVLLRLNVSNFRQPTITGHVSGQVALRELSKLLHLPSTSDYQGVLSGAVEAKGSGANRVDKHFEQPLTWKGSIHLRGGSFRLPRVSEKCTEVSGEAKFISNLLHLQNVTGKIGSHSFGFVATIQHLLAYQLGRSPTITVTGTLEADQINTKWLADTVKATQGNKTATKAKKTSKLNPIIPHFLQLYVGLQCSQVILPVDTINNLRVQLQSDKRQISLTNLFFKVWSGSIQGSVSVPNNLAHLNQTYVQLDGRFKSLDFTSVKQNTPSSRFTRRPTGASPSPTPSDIDLKNILLSTKAQIRLEVGLIKLPGGENVKDLSFRLHKNNTQVQISTIRFQTTRGGKAAGEGTFRLTGNQVSTPYLNLRLKYGHIDLQRFMQQVAAIGALLPTKAERQKRVRPANKLPLFDDKYRVHLQVKADHLLYQHLNGQDFVLQAKLDKSQALLEAFRLRAFGGLFASRGVMYLNGPANTFPVWLRTQLQGVNLSQLFSVADQMNLDVLQSHNIRGSIDCDLAVHTKLDASFAPSVSKTVAYSKATIHNMELIQVQAIQHALRFLRKERTKHLYFEDLTTHFILQENQFITPGVTLNNNISQFQLSGKYTMHGPADLYMDLNIFEVLFGNNSRRIERIQGDSLTANDPPKKQHLLVFREQNNYKVKLFNKKDHELAQRSLETEFQRLLSHHKIDTVFTVMDEVIQTSKQ